MRAYEFISSNILIESVFHSDLSSPENKKSVIDLMNQLFGGYDIGNADGAANTVEDALKHVDWNKSFAFFDDQGECESALLIAHRDLVTHLKENNNQHMQPLVDTLIKNKLSSIEGVALYIKPGFPTSDTLKAMRHLRSMGNTENIDFIFGLALAELNNMGFWSKHSIYLGQQMEDGVPVNIFAIPFNRRAQQVLAEYSREHAQK